MGRIGWLIRLLAFLSGRLAIGMPTALLPSPRFPAP
jgi:hypothetical protein